MTLSPPQPCGLQRDTWFRLPNEFTSELGSCFVSGPPNFCQSLVLEFHEGDLPWYTILQVATEATSVENNENPHQAWLPCGPQILPPPQIPRFCTILKVPQPGYLFETLLLQQKGTLFFVKQHVQVSWCEQTCGNLLLRDLPLRMTLSSAVSSTLLTLERVLLLSESFQAPYFPSFEPPCTLQSYQYCSGFSISSSCAILCLLVHSYSRSANCLTPPSSPSCVIRQMVEDKTWLLEKSCLFPQIRGGERNNTHWL